MNWIKSNFWEIERSPLLCNAGALLSFLHVITYFFWSKKELLSLKTEAKPLLCWSFLPNCQNASLLSPGIISMMLTTFLVTSCVAIIFFLWRRALGFAWFLLFLAFVSHLVVYLYDASLASDVQLLCLLLNFSFLFVPNKGSLFRLLIFFFYMVLTYKLWNPDWLSGAAIENHFPFPLKGLEWVAAMTLISYLTLPFLLLSPIIQRLLLGVGGLLLVHAIYFFYQRDHSSIIMFFLNFFFLLDYFDKKRLERESLYQSYEHPEPSRLWPTVACGVFLLAQTQLLAGQHIFELLKLQGPAHSAQCLRFTYLKTDQAITEISSVKPTMASTELQCHPLLNFNFFKDLCRQHENDEGFKTISHYFFTRRLGDKNYRKVFAESDFCRKDYTYSPSRESL